MIWDYHQYKHELFKYVKDFFKQQKINCRINYSPIPFTQFTTPDEKAVEIYDSTESFTKRHQFLTRENPKSQQAEQVLLSSAGQALPNLGIALINGAWEEFRDCVPIEKVKEQMSESYKGITKKEYLIRTNAGNICHEVLHCLSLFHPESFFPPLVKREENGIPNIMSYNLPIFSKNLPVGYDMTDFQRKLVHSYLAGNNTYKTFLLSGSNIDIFTNDILNANKPKIILRLP